MNDLQKFLNDFLDFSNRTVLFTTMIILLVVLIALVSFIRKKKKKKLSTESSDGTEFNEDFSKDEIQEEIQGDSNAAEDSANSSEDPATEEVSEDFNEDSAITENSSEENFSKDDSNAADDSAITESNTDFSKDESSEDEMEALLSEDSDDLYSAEMIENFFGNLGKQEIGNAKEVVEEIKNEAELQQKKEKEAELQEKKEKETPVELILHDQISIDEKEPEEVNKEEKEEKHTAITLIDGSDRVMVSVGEKFEAKHTKDFTIEVKDEPEITIAMQDGFVFDGRIHFFVSLSEALAKHITLKDVTEITGPKGSYSGYEIKLEIADKGDLESIDCTRSFNYKKVKDAVLIIQLSLK